MRSLWIDADSCSKSSRRIAIRAALRYQLPIILVSNHQLKVNARDVIHTVCVAEGKDVADQYILSRAAAHDVVVTRDILMAKKLLRKNILVMNDFGNIFQLESIDGKLIEVETLQAIRNEVGQKRARGKKDFSRVFARSLEALLVQ